MVIMLLTRFALLKFDTKLLLVLPITFSSVMDVE